VTDACVDWPEGLHLTIAIVGLNINFTKTKPSAVRIKITQKCERILSPTLLPLGQAPKILNSKQLLFTNQLLAQHSYLCLRSHHYPLPGRMLTVNVQQSFDHVRSMKDTLARIRTLIRGYFLSPGFYPSQETPIARPPN